MSKILEKEIKRRSLSETNSFHLSQLKTNVEGIITAELVGGQSIDNAIDALIATHASDDDAHHDHWNWRSGDIDVWDFDEDNNDFSTIGDVVNTWYDLDISGIVGSNSGIAGCLVNIKDGAAGSQVRFRKNGDTGDMNHIKCNTQVANQGQTLFFECGFDSSGKMEFNGYNVKASDWTKLELIILCWQVTNE